MSIKNKMDDLIKMEEKQTTVGQMFKVEYSRGKLAIKKY